MDEALKDLKDEDKTTSDCSDKEVADFLMQVNEDLKDHKDEDKTTSDCSDQGVADFPKLLDEVPNDYKGKVKAATRTTNGHRSVTSTGSGTAPAKAEPKPKGKRVKMRTFKATQQVAHGGHAEGIFKGIFEDDILHFAVTFEQRSISPCDFQEMITPLPSTGGRHSGSATPERDRNGQPAARGERDRRGSRRPWPGDEGRPQE